jgi:hypothetical protein
MAKQRIHLSESEGCHRRGEDTKTKSLLLHFIKAQENFEKITRTVLNKFNLENHHWLKGNGRFRRILENLECNLSKKIG